LTVTAGATVRLDGSPSSIPGRPSSTVGYVWGQKAGPIVALSDPFGPVTTFVAPDLGDGLSHTYVVGLLVDDAVQQSAPAVATITVLPPGTSTFELALRPGMNLVGLPYA